MSAASFGPFDVKAVLTGDLPPISVTARPASRRKRRRSEVENDDFAEFVARIIRGHGRRIGQGDVEGLVELLDLAKELDAATQLAVDGLRDRGYSWTEIGSRLGTSRQAAQQRWGR